MKLLTGQIIRHKGERKVVRQVYKDNQGKIVIEFVDRTKCSDMKDIEIDGRK
jgi:hypothetical protein